MPDATKNTSGTKLIWKVIRFSLQKETSFGTKSIHVIKEKKRQNITRAHSNLKKVTNSNLLYFIKDNMHGNIGETILIKNKLKEVHRHSFLLTFSGSLSQMKTLFTQSALALFLSLLSIFFS